jgi:hypothetical protein
MRLRTTMSRGSNKGGRELAEVWRCRRRALSPLLYRGNRLHPLLPLGMVEALALPGQNYRLAFYTRSIDRNLPPP